MIVLFMLLISRALNQDCFYEKNCASCVDDYCSKCYFSIFSSKEKKCLDPDIQVKFCYEYMNSDSIQCMNCKYGYGLNQYNQCYKCEVENCAKCDRDPSVCNACLNGKKIDQNKKCGEELENCKDQNCQICSDNDICLKCKKDYSFDKYLQCVKGLPNCDFLNPSNHQRCSICKPGYHMDRYYLCTDHKSEQYSVLATCVFWTVAFVVFVIFLFLIYHSIEKFEFRDERRSSLDKYEGAMIN